MCIVYSLSITHCPISGLLHSATESWNETFPRRARARRHAHAPAHHTRKYSLDRVAFDQEREDCEEGGEGDRRGGEREESGEWDRKSTEHYCASALFFIFP
jgi:hypothetical protein